MAPQDWEDEESDNSTPPSSPPPVVRRGKFDDEEDDGDIADDWDAADDSEAEREKAKKASEAKAKADAAAKASHKSKSQRVAAHLENKARRKQELEDEESSEEEDESSHRARLKREQKEADLMHAEDLFGDLNLVSNNRTSSKPVTIQDSKDPTSSVDLSSLPLFNPSTKDQFNKLRDALTPLLNNNAKKAHYIMFMQEFTKQICKELQSDQVKKISSALTALANEKMKEEKAAEKGGKKTKASKNKSSLVATRDISYKADVSAYDDGLEDDDFM